MEISFKYDDNYKISKSTPIETIEDVMNEIYILLIAFGFSKESVEKTILDKAEQIKKEKKQ